jgi:nucleoside-diphosphate-sugar epimerase
VSEAINLNNDVQFLELPWVSFQSLQEFDITLPDKKQIRNGKIAMGSTAFYFHSSGTTGLPKLIPQTHNGAVGILPKLQDLGSSIQHVGTFTTTPLYHGGIADLLRCWSAASPVWLFPEGKLPIIGSTVSTIIHGIDKISKNERTFPTSRLGYVSCVPYVLDSLSKTPELKARLCDLDAVGVGGASMPQELGDDLVANGVRLVSRFGSSECGFLLSSQRDYETDKIWNIHRCPDSKGLRFAPLSNGRYELIVTADWPLVSTAVHSNRSFNTHDIFVAHEGIPEAWQYVGRSDCQLTLSTGKKFDPTEMEERVRQSNLIEDIIIIGNDKPFASAMIFASHETRDMQPEQRCDGVWLAIKKANASVSSHARIEEKSFVILDLEQYRRVRKNNKGGVIRSAIHSDFKKELSSIYGHNVENDGNVERLEGEDDISTFVTAIVQTALGSTRTINRKDDLFRCGIDSVLSLQIRKQISAVVPVKLRSQIPLHIVYECGTISAITKYISNLLVEGEMRPSLEDLKITQYQEMEDMVQKFVSTQAEMLSQTVERNKQQPIEKTGHGMSVVLTGSTGFLGVHMLKLLIENELVSTIFLCVRGSNMISPQEQEEGAKARVRSALTFHNMFHALPDHWETKVEYIPLILGEFCLGISPSLYSRVAAAATHVIHAAWEVNFNLPLKTFSPQVKGTTELFNLALLASRQHGKGPVSLLFCSSVASIANMPKTDRATVFPILSENPSHAANLGYGQSKWVAENVLMRLNRQHPSEVTVSILRIGQLSGDTLNGIWNLREAWPLMLQTSLEVTGRSGNTAAKEKIGNIILPDLAITTLHPLDWLPVDRAAQCIWRNMDGAKLAAAKNLQVLNIVNKGIHGAVTWRQAQDWIFGWAEARAFHATAMPPDQWLDKLESFPTDHRAKALVSLWRQNWMPKHRDKGRIVNGSVGKCDSENPPQKHLERTRAQADRKVKGKSDVEVGIDCYVLDEEYFWRIMDWVLLQCSSNA